jgi:hypothetical protein
VKRCFGGFWQCDVAGFPHKCTQKRTESKNKAAPRKHDARGAALIAKSIIGLPGLSTPMN